MSNQDLKYIRSLGHYIPNESKDIHYEHIHSEIYDLYIYDVPFCSLPLRGTVLDLGANVGMFATYAIVRKAAYVYCFEPARICLPSLYKNLESYKDKCSILPYGVWSKKGSFTFKEYDDFSGCNHISSIDDGNYKVKATTIDDTVSELNLKRVDFIKFDVEGAELEALKGGFYTIKTFKPKMAVSVYHKQNDETDLVDYIQSITNYKISIINHTYIGIKIAYCY